MMFVDPRAGSCNYPPLLRALGAEVDDTVQIETDVLFYGSGRVVGIELKKFDDALTCMVTGRFSGSQLLPLALLDDAFLIIEGLWRPHPDDGVLETWGWDKEKEKMGWIPAGRGKRRFMYRDFDAYLTTIEIKGGVRVKRSSSPQETARLVYSLYQWFQDVEGHRSHLALNRAGRDGAIFIRPTFARRVAAELPGVGFERSADVATAFPTVRQMIDATEKEWRAVKGIGKKLAKQIAQAWDDAA